MGTNTAGLAFDRAGNVYVISNSSERLGVWSLPKVENVFTTPAPNSEKLDVISEVPQLEKEKTEILLYPNPVSNYLRIESKNATLKMVTIYDLRGSLVRSERISGISAEISTDNLPAGNYIIKVQTENKVITKRIIKQ